MIFLFSFGRRSSRLIPSGRYDGYDDGYDDDDDDVDLHASASYSLADEILRKLTCEIIDYFPIQQ